MSIPFQSPNIHLASSPNLLSNPNHTWSKSPTDHNMGHLALSASTSPVLQKTQIETLFPRVPKTEPIPSKLGNQSSPTGPTQPGVSDYNIDAQDLVSALNNCFSANKFSHERQTEVNLLATPTQAEQSSSQPDQSSFIVEYPFTTSNHSFIIPGFEDERHSENNVPLPRELLSNMSLDPAAKVQEDVYQLITIDDVLGFMDSMEVATVTVSPVNPVSEAEKQREGIASMAFIRQYLATIQPPSEGEDATPKFGAVPYTPRSVHSDELIEELFGPGDARRGRTWAPPKHQLHANKTKLSSTSSAADDEILDENDEGPVDSLPEPLFSDDKLQLDAGTSGDSTGAVEDELLHAWDSDPMDNQTPDLVPASDVVGIMDDISSLLLDDEVRDSSQPTSQSANSQVEMNVEPHDTANQTSAKFSFGQPNLLGPPFFTPLTPETFFGIDQDGGMQEPLAPTTEIEEVPEGPDLPIADPSGQSLTSYHPIGTQEGLVASSKGPTSKPSANNASSSSTSSVINSRLPWSSLQLTIFDTKSSAWSNENMAVLQQRFGTFDDDHEAQDRLLIGLRPAIPTGDEEIWYEFSQDREEIALESDEEDIPLFLPSYTETDIEDDELIDISDGEMIPHVATLATAKVSTPTPMHNSSKRPRRPSTKAHGQTSNATAVPTTPRQSRVGETRYLTQPSFTGNIGQIAFDSDEDDQLQEDTAPPGPKMGPPPRKRKRLTKSTTVHPTTPRPSSSKHHRR